MYSTAQLTKQGGFKFEKLIQQKQNPDKYYFNIYLVLYLL